MFFKKDQAHFSSYGKKDFKREESSKSLAKESDKGKGESSTSTRTSNINCFKFFWKRSYSCLVPYQKVYNLKRH